MTRFSNAALHWMRTPEAVIDGMWRALLPGGRFVAEMGAAGNVRTITDALVTTLARRGIDGASLVPWHFPSVAAYRECLLERGFEVRRIESCARPTPLPTDTHGWLATFAAVFTAPLPAPQ